MLLTHRLINLDNGILLIFAESDVRGIGQESEIRKLFPDNRYVSGINKRDIFEYSGAGGILATGRLAVASSIE